MAGGAGNIREMRALTVDPGHPDSIYFDTAPPQPDGGGAVLVRALALFARRVPLSRSREAFERRSGDIKVVIDFSEA